MQKISLIIPCYNEEEVLPLFYRTIGRVAQEMSDYAWEFDFVDDGSADRTLEILRKMAQLDKRVRYTSFSRNFGKEAAIFAGLHMVTGDLVAVIDADLQHRPEHLREMAEALESGEYDCAATRRTDRAGEPAVRSWFSRLFYRLMGRFSNANLADGAQDYRMMKRYVADTILSMGEYNRFTKGIFGWVGFRTKWIPCENTPRAAGKTKWSFKKLFRYSLEGITAFSTAPLAAAFVFGGGFFLASLVLLICAIIRGKAFLYTLFAVFLVGGALAVCIGVLGLYLGKTYLETKRRPVYIVKETEKGQR